MSMQERWSRPVESLLEPGGPPLACEVLVVGSGYGGSVAAAELAAPGREVWVMERGREYALGEFPEDIGQLPGHVRFQATGRDAPVGNADALLDLRVFDQAGVLLANGLGGGSLINAGVAIVPDAELLDDPAWPSAYRREGAQRQALLAAMREAADRLDAAPVPRPGELAKFAALDRLGQAIGCAPAQAVPVTITHRDRVNAQGVPQRACIQCGNCFTGCNTGAKNTLATNLIPQAARAGARFFTGATAVEIEPLAGPERRWRVHFALTSRVRAEPQVRHFTVDTHTLVLSAGTLGSTELLLRSPKVSRSGRLGHAFSANGDAIAMGWGHARRVNGLSAPRPDSAAPSTDVGPTIVGTLRTSVEVNGRDRPVLIQDGAVPSALSMAVVALGSTLSSLHRYTQERAPAAYGEGLSVDALATPERIGEHALLLLAMGRDDANGVISCKDGRLDITWPRFDGPADGRPAQGGRAEYFDKLHRLLEGARDQGGFDGGDYLPNPAWRPVPDKFAGITGGNQPERLVTVHPLGGCAMADDAAHGVVDRHGAVFSGASGTAVHAGLHVLDGAIVPCAVGVNPFVTISALCLLAARELRTQLEPRRAARADTPLAHSLPAVQPRVGERVFDRCGPVRLGFEERLQSVDTGRAPPPWALELAKRTWPDRPLPDSPGGRDWVVVVKLRMDVHRWLADPGEPLPAELAVYRNPYPESQTVREEILRAAPMLKGRGTVTLLALDAPRTGAEAREREGQAFWAYLQRRSVRDLSVLAGSGPSPKEAWKLFWRAAGNHAAYRELRYEFDLVPADATQSRVRASGRKRLAYRPDERNLWDALTRLDLRLEAGASQPAWELPLDVDLTDLVKNRRLQVLEAPNTPAVIVAMASFFAMWARTLLRTNFWAFRGLSYDKLAKVRVPAPPPLQPGGSLAPVVTPTRHVLEVPGGHGQVSPVRLELVRYVPPQAVDGRCILFIHGLAHGSGVFTTDTVDGNLATHFLQQGYTVWLLDHRLSNRLDYAGQPHTMDDVAQHDVAHALRRVHAANGGRPVDVFAHCVGAGAFAMSILGGHADPAMVRATVLHAVHPWVVPSVSNRFSAALAALYKDALGHVEVDPVPPSGRGTALDELLDRFAASLPWARSQRFDHQENKYDPRGGFAACNRMTLFYGREWEHGNLDERTHDRLAELVGVAGIEVFRQLFFIISRERLTNREGANVYLRQDQVRERWTFPTLFAHGGRNRVFDPRAAVRSWQRMKLLLDDQPADRPRPVHLFVREGYGHMDFLFGKDAHREVFPALSRFLLEPEAFASTVGGRKAEFAGVNVVDGEDISDKESRAPVAPWCGPMLQVERGSAGQRRLVLWFEQRSDTTSRPLPPVLGIDGVRVEATSLQLPLPAAQARAGTPVRQGADHYWTVVLDEGNARRFDALKVLRLEAKTETPQVGTPLGVPTLGFPMRIPQGPLGPDDGVWVMKPGVIDLTRLGWLQDVLRALRREPEAPSPRPDDDEHRPVDLALGHLPWWRRWVGRLPATVPVSLLAASCRWPGTPFDQSGADALAAAMDAHVDHPQRPVDGLVLLGDQIYADATANIAETTEVSERRPRRYRDAWAGKATAALFRRLPVWLLPDDHEYDENLDGPGSAGGRRPDGAFVEGFEATYAYQWRWHRQGGPRLPDENGKGLRGFWHEFSIGGIPAFAADTRSERERRTGANWLQAPIMGADQVQAIQDWLRAHRTEPKILCCGSVFGLPERRILDEPALARYADDWCGYPAAWQELARFIAVEGIRNLVILAGDYHLSAVAELEIHAAGVAQPARVVSVVASGWNASLPFANPRPFDHVWDASVRLPCGCPSVDVWSRARVLSRAPRQFTKLSIVPRGADWMLEVQSHGPDIPHSPPISLRL